MVDGGALPGSDPAVTDSVVPASTCTPEDVRRWLVAVFITMPTTPIYSRRGGVSAVSLDVPDATFCWLTFLEQTIAEREVRHCVLIWAKAEAAREVRRRGLNIDIPRASIPDACREFGWQRRTFDRRVEAAVKKLAAARSRRDAPPPPIGHAA